MDGNIKVDAASVAGHLSEFQAQMSKMEALFDEVKTQTSQVSSYWAGKVGDETIVALQQFHAMFQQMDTQNEKYVTFLNNTIDTYTRSEKNISTAIDSAANAGLGINGSGL